MPQLVSELISGKTFERNADNGRLADSAVRQWRILLSSPSEAFDISAAPPNGVGVKIGDKLDSINPIPCVSLSVAADGSNKMTRLVTARYAATLGGETGTGNNPDKDPGTDPPHERLSTVSVSTSIAEVPSWTWYSVTSAGTVDGARKAAINPAKDMYDGVMKVEPISVITVEQFDYPTDPTVHCQHIGKVNSNATVWRGLTINKRCLIFRGLTFKPQNIFFGDTLYRGWQCSYEFALRNNQQRIAEGELFETMVTSNIGWDIAMPQTGFNYLDNGVRRRATVTLPGSSETVPSAQPVPLNNDGSLRNPNLQLAVLVKRYGIHEEADFSSIFSHLRLSEGS